MFLYLCVERREAVVLQMSSPFNDSPIERQTAKQHIYIRKLHSQILPSSVLAEMTWKENIKNEISFCSLLFQFRTRL